MVGPSSEVNFALFSSFAKDLSGHRTDVAPSGWYFRYGNGRPDIPRALDIAYEEALGLWKISKDNVRHVLRLMSIKMISPFLPQAFIGGNIQVTELRGQSQMNTPTLIIVHQTFQAQLPLSEIFCRVMASISPKWLLLGKNAGEKAITLSVAPVMRPSLKSARIPHLHNVNFSAKRRIACFYTIEGLVQQT